MEERTPSFQESNESTEPPRRSSDKPGWKWILIGVGAIILVGLILYLIGFYQGRSRVEIVEQQLTALQQDLDQSRAQLILTRDQGRMMQALALVYRTLLDLDERNFGIANTRIQQASQVLSTIETEELRSAELQTLQRELQETDIRVAANLEDQYNRIAALAERLRALQPEEMSVPSSPETPQ